MFGERTFGQPIRPPQPRFSQGIERSPDGVFQGIRPPGTADFPRSQATREAREFRYQEWLIPEGERFRPLPDTLSPEMSATPWSMPPAPPELSPTPSSEIQRGEQAFEEVTGQPAGVGESSEIVPPAGVEAPGAGPGIPADVPNPLPAPTRWLNSTRAPTRDHALPADTLRSHRRSVTHTNWREEVKSYLQQTERSRVVTGPAWVALLEERVSRAIGPAAVEPIRLSIQGGTATVEGKVTSQEAADLVVRLLLLEPGIWEVVSRLEVVRPQ